MIGYVIYCFFSGFFRFESQFFRHFSCYFPAQIFFLSRFFYFFVVCNVVCNTLSISRGCEIDTKKPFSWTYEKGFCLSGATFSVLSAAPGALVRRSFDFWDFLARLPKSTQNGLMHTFYFYFVLNLTSLLPRARVGFFSALPRIATTHYFVLPNN